MTRRAAHDRFDAIVDLLGDAPGRQRAYGLVKVTYAVDDAGMRVTAPQPLFHDIRKPDTKPRLLPGSDFWPNKIATDVVVLGSVHAPRPVESSRVALEVGDRVARIAVFGERHIEWDERGRPRIGAPATFTEIPLGLASAYGGVDPRIELPIAQLPTAATEHRGAYPRNPFGKGYLVQGERIDGIGLPNLERVDDLLTDERLIVGDPARWWLQPRPAHLGFVPANVFPRSALLGAWPLDAAPDDAQLAERRAGLALGKHGSGFDPRFVQEAMPELVFPALTTGTPFAAHGMRPDGRVLRFQLPAPPELELSLAGERLAATRVLGSVVIAPAKGTVALVWIVRSQPLARVLVPGIHRELPLRMSVGGVPIAHEGVG